jgi:hypothetical protein
MSQSNIIRINYIPLKQAPNQKYGDKVLEDLYEIEQQRTPKKLRWVLNVPIDEMAKIVYHKWAKENLRFDTNRFEQRDIYQNTVYWDPVSTYSLINTIKHKFNIKTYKETDELYVYLMNEYQF